MAEVRKVIEVLDKRAANPSVELKDDGEVLPPGPERKPPAIEPRLFRLREGAAREHKARIDELLSRTPLATQKIAINFKGDLAEVYAPAELMADVRKLLEPLGAEGSRGRGHVKRTRRGGRPAEPGPGPKTVRTGCGPGQAWRWRPPRKTGPASSSCGSETPSASRRWTRNRSHSAQAKIELQKAMAKLEAVASQEQAAPDGKSTSGGRPRRRQSADGSAAVGTGRGRGQAGGRGSRGASWPMQTKFGRNRPAR